MPLPGNSFFRSRFAKLGLPFLLLVIGGSFGLKEFAQLRYQFTGTTSLSAREFEKHGIEKKPSKDITLESEYEKLKKLDIDNWEQKRGPRPWEEDTIAANAPKANK